MLTRRQDDPRTYIQTQKTPYVQNKWLFIKPRAIKVHEECCAFFTVSSHCTTKIKAVHLLTSLVLTHTHIHTRTHTHTHTFTLTNTLTFTHTLTNTHSRTLAHTLTNTHSHTFTNTLTHTLTKTHTLSHTHTLKHTHTHTHTFKQGSLMKHEKSTANCNTFRSDTFHNEPQATYRFHSLCSPLNKALGTTM